jgi:hypothetical protein
MGQENNSHHSSPENCSALEGHIHSSSILAHGTGRADSSQRKLLSEMQKVGLAVHLLRKPGGP